MEACHKTNTMVGLLKTRYFALILKIPLQGRLKDTTFDPISPIFDIFATSHVRVLEAGPKV